MCSRTAENEEMKKIKYCLDQMSVPENTELKELQKMQINQLTHISFISAPECNGESENRKILHGSEEDSGQRGTMCKMLLELSIKQAVNFLSVFKIAIIMIHCSMFFFTH